MSPAERTPQYILDRMVSVYPEREIITVSGEDQRTYTYAEFEDRVCQVAGALGTLDLSDGATVGVIGRNSHRYLELYFGPPCAGHPLHTCNPHHPDEHLIYMLNNAETEVLFFDPAFVDTVERIAEDLDHIVQYVVLDDGNAEEGALEPITDYERLIEGQDTTYDWPELDPGRTYAIGYTSGTTGRPKGMAFSHEAVLSQSVVAGHSASYDLDSDDTIMLGLHMYYPMSAGFLTGALLTGAELVLPTTEDPAHLAKVIDRTRVTNTQFATPIFLDIQEHARETDGVDISSLEEVKLGGDPPDTSVMRDAKEAYDLDVVHTYGQTEAIGMACLSRLKPWMRDLPLEEQFEIKKKAGLPHPAIDARVRDLDGEPVPADSETIGELQLRGQWVIDGYVGLPEKNAEAFTEDGWFKTEDMATIDEHSYIDIVDRKEEMIECGDDWLSSSRIGKEIMAHDDVKSAVVLAVEDDDLGERPLGVVVSASDRSVSESDLRAFLAAELPEGWIPEEFVIVEEIPRTSVGNFDKRALKEQLASYEFADG